MYSHTPHSYRLLILSPKTYPHGLWILTPCTPDYSSISYSDVLAMNPSNKTSTPVEDTCLSLVSSPTCSKFWLPVRIFTLPTIFPWQRISHLHFLQSSTPLLQASAKWRRVLASWGKMGFLCLTGIRLPSSRKWWCLKFCPPSSTRICTGMFPSRFCIWRTTNRLMVFQSSTGKSSANFSNNTRTLFLCFRLWWE